MISIIIPVYNQAKALDKCLASIKNQSIDNYEVIIVNDGSRDNIQELINKWEKKFAKFKYFSQKNQGAPSARNLGFKKSEGDYLFFCDADAVLNKFCLEKMLKILKESRVSYVYSSFYWGTKKFKLFPFDKEKLKNTPYIHTMSLIKRKDFPPEQWDVNIKKFQDWDLWLTMLKHNKTGQWIDEFLFTISPGGTMSSWLPSFAYKLLPFLPSVKKYKYWQKIIKDKHKNDF